MFWDSQFVGLLDRCLSVRFSPPFFSSPPSFPFPSITKQKTTVYTLSTFSSLLLVTITVTRKMLTMILSVLWFGHRLGGKQWFGVALVFGGVAAEGVMNRREKSAKLLKQKQKQEEMQKAKKL
jgi:hypothetical protein